MSDLSLLSAFIHGNNDLTINMRVDELTWDLEFRGGEIRLTLDALKSPQVIEGSFEKMSAVNRYLINEALSHAKLLIRAETTPHVRTLEDEKNTLTLLGMMSWVGILSSIPLAYFTKHSDLHGLLLTVPLYLLYAYFIGGYFKFKREVKIARREREVSGANTAYANYTRMHDVLVQYQRKLI